MEAYHSLDAEARSAAEKLHARAPPAVPPPAVDTAARKAAKKKAAWKLKRAELGLTADERTAAIKKRRRSKKKAEKKAKEEEAKRRATQKSSQDGSEKDKKPPTGPALEKRLWSLTPWGKFTPLSLPYDQQALRVGGLHFFTADYSHKYLDGNNVALHTLHMEHAWHRQSYGLKCMNALGQILTQAEEGAVAQKHTKLNESVHITMAQHAHNSSQQICYHP